jgi:hypothetical protein
MENGFFKFENDLLKHHVRTMAWLPTCRRRLAIVRHNSRPGKQRKLRYFTFCAVGAIDVLMLDVAKIVTPSRSTHRFDTVFFFDKSQELVIETQKRIPGAIGFPGDFIDVVLAEDPNENMIGPNQDALLPPQTLMDDHATRIDQLKIATQQSFVRSFPFDVINLDLEEFLFKPNDPFPGKLVNAIRKIFDWQKRRLIIPHIVNCEVESFSLMFTTQIGPPNLSEQYLDLLHNTLQRNLDEDRSLSEELMQRSGTSDISVLQREKFDDFFKISMPKVLAAISMEKDWYIDPITGISIFEFERPSQSGNYKMLHLVMDIKRQNPSLEHRAPGQNCVEANDAYRNIVRQIINRREIVILEEQLNKEDLQNDLDRIKARRKLYYIDPTHDEEIIP